MLSKRGNQNLQKSQGRKNLKRNLKILHTKINFIWIKKARNKVWQSRGVELVEFEYVEYFTRLNVFHRV